VARNFKPPDEDKINELPVIPFASSRDGRIELYKALHPDFGSSYHPKVLREEEKFSKQVPIFFFADNPIPGKR
jgi:hypothetical protein